MAGRTFAVVMLLVVVAIGAGIDEPRAHVMSESLGNFDNGDDGDFVPVG